MTNLNQLFDQNQGFFDTEEPSDGHFERFGLKLAAQNRMRRAKRTLFTFARIAAGITLIVAVSVWFIYQSNSTWLKNKGPIAKNYELIEAEQFYNQMLQSRFETLKQLKFPDEVQKAKILQEVSQPDDTYSRLQEDLKSDPENERAINAMVNYYQIRVEVLNNIILKLKQILNNSQTYKQNSHETFI